MNFFKNIKIYTLQKPQQLPWIRRESCWGPMFQREQRGLVVVCKETEVSITRSSSVWPKGIW